MIVKFTPFSFVAVAIIAFTPLMPSASYATASHATASHTTTKAKSSQAGCNANASAPWLSGPTPRMKIETSSVGASCATAIATFSVRDASGKIVHRQSYPASSLAMTTDAVTRTQMQAALANWAGAGRVRNVHMTIPNWEASESMPEPAEVDFTPTAGVTRTAYMAVKTNRTPLLCYVQDFGSLKCLVLRRGRLEPFGVQSLP